MKIDRIRKRYSQETIVGQSIKNNETKKIIKKNKKNDNNKNTKN